MPEVRDIKQAASGRWRELLVRYGGVPDELLDGTNRPCPKCQGKDRFRFIDADAGACYCNQCFSTKNGDGIAALMWLRGESFHDVMGLLGRELGLSNGEQFERDLVDEVAYRKRVTADSLAAHGATNAERGQLKVCRVPMHDADMQVVGYLDLAPEPEEFVKGKMTKGCHHGLFVAVPPKPGETVAVVEGVKDAAALHALGIVAVGLPTNKMAADFARFFRDTNVVIVPDRDKAGISGAEETARRLFGVAASVRIAELPAEYSETYYASTTASGRYAMRSHTRSPGARTSRTVPASLRNSTRANNSWGWTSRLTIWCMVFSPRGNHALSVAGPRV